MIYSHVVLHCNGYWMMYRGPGFLAVLWLGSSPTLSPPPSPVSISATGDTQDQKTETESQLADGRMRGGGWRGAESYDRYKAWSCINQYSLRVTNCNGTTCTNAYIVYRNFCHPLTWKAYSTRNNLVYGTHHGRKKRNSAILSAFFLSLNRQELL